MKTIKVTGQFFGVHHWPEAPDEVAHLRNKHAHTFRVSAEMEVDHTNRQVEFFIAKKNLASLCARMSEQLEQSPTLSCEEMATRIACELGAKWQYKVIRVSVEEPEIGEGSYIVPRYAYRNTVAECSVPIGAILPWIKHETLDERFVECNGQKISDITSVFNGAEVPDLRSGNRGLHVFVIRIK